MSQQQPDPKHTAAGPKGRTHSPGTAARQLSQSKEKQPFSILKSCPIFFPNPSEFGYMRCNIPSGNCISCFLRCIWRICFPACPVCGTALQRNDLLFLQQPLPPPVCWQSYSPAAPAVPATTKGLKPQPPCSLPQTLLSGQKRPKIGLTGPPASSCTEARIIHRS